MCSCLECGGTYSLCFPCLEAMVDLGMAKARIEEHVIESGNNFTPRHVTEVVRHDLTRCPREDGVRAAVLLGRNQ